MRTELKNRLRSEISHRFSEGQKDLSSQNMEVVCRSGAVHHNPVTVTKLANSKVLCDFLHEQNVY